MVKSLFSGVSGLKTHQQRMDVIGNNIANVNTDGFKTYVTSFADIYYQTKKTASGSSATLGGSNPRQIGYGVKMNTTTQNMGASGFKYSDSVYDLALDGEGFFQVMDGAGNIFYTRAGNFSVDDFGYLVTAGGYHVLGVSGNSDGQAADSEIIRLTVPDTHAKASSATKKINGVNCTISVSAPSDVSDMSVTFTDSEFPFATYSEGVLNIFLNMDEQFNSEMEFQQRIDEAIDAGGVTLPDDLTLKFEFESVPSEVDAKRASNTSPDWRYSLARPTGSRYYDFYVPNGTDAGVSDVLMTSPPDADASKYDHATLDIAFSGASGYSLHNGVTFDFATDNSATADADGDGVVDDTFVPTATLDLIDEENPGRGYYNVAARYSSGGWTIYVSDKATSVSASEINKAISRAREASPDTIPSLTCEKFTYKCDTKFSPAVFTNLQTAVQAKADADAGAAGLTDVSALEISMIDGESETPFSFTAVAGADGAEANNYKITFAYASGRGNTRAVWDENNLTITICDDTTIDEIEQRIKSAANGDLMRTITIPEMKGIPQSASLDVINPSTGEYEFMTPAQRKALFEKNPSITLAGGDDSFFTKTAKCLTTFNVSDGRTGDEQSYKNLEDVSIGTDGTIIGKHAIHGTIVLGRIDIATFDNPNGLDAAGGTMFRATEASGEPEVNIPGENGAAEIVSGATEMSNVDLADEFTNMIATQRGYQANSRVVTTSDTMLEELLSLKR